MTVPDDVAAAILRYFYVEKWKKNTIASQLNIHYTTVERVLLQNGVSSEQLASRSSMVDAFAPFIQVTLTEFPTLNAKRLYEMVKQRGYAGGPDHFRHMVARYRPRVSESAFLRLSTLPGEQSQVDWASFGRIKIGNAERKLSAFVMVLSWSRYIFLKFYVNQSGFNFYQGHVEAFEFFGGLLTKQLYYDNLKAVVIERIGRAIHFNPQILALAGHYRFKPTPVEVAQPEQKGRVERAIRYIRSSFWPARDWKDLDDLNNQALEWCRGESAERKWVQDETLTVREAFEQEKPYMLAVPVTSYPLYERREARVGKTPYASFDLNLYSVQAKYVRTTVSIFATQRTVRICSGAEEIAVHDRCFGKGEVIEDGRHISDLKEAKVHSGKHRALDRLRIASPSSRDFLVLAGQRGHNLGRMTQLLEELLDLYGGSELEASIKESLLSDRAHVWAVKQALDRRRSEQGRPNPVRLRFANQKANELAIEPRSLETYDTLTRAKLENEQ